MIKISDFGIRDYREVLKLQEEYFGGLVADKSKGIAGQEYLLTGEHPDVITIGRRGKKSNILWSENQLIRKGVELIHTGRGGDVTYHCPGQMIVYPILDLEKHGLGVKKYVELLEDSVITLLSQYGIEGYRIEGATGVWLGKGTDEARKICAIGIKCSRFCCMHGLSLNVNNDLSGFRMINPCGFTDKGVTSMSKEQGKEINFGEVKEKFLKIFLSLLSGNHKSSSA